MPTIILIDSPAHPLPVPAYLALRSQLVHIPVDHWENALTPWPAPALFAGEPPFGGQATSTLTAIERSLPANEPVALYGYPLDGLFALWAFMPCMRFCAAASLSGSPWYPGWLD